MKAVFKKQVKYKGEYYGAGVAIEISEQEADDLKRHGAELFGDATGKDKSHDDDDDDDDNHDGEHGDGNHGGDGEDDGKATGSAAHSLENASIEELKAYAAEKNIDLGKSTSRNGIMEKIKAADKEQEA